MLACPVCSGQTGDLREGEILVRSPPARLGAGRHSGQWIGIVISDARRASEWEGVVELLPKRGPSIRISRQVRISLTQCGGTCFDDLVPAISQLCVQVIQEQH